MGLGADWRVRGVHALRRVDDAGRRGVRRLLVHEAHARVADVALVHGVQRDRVLGVLDARVVRLPRLGRGDRLSLSASCNYAQARARLTGKYCLYPHQAVRTPTMPPAMTSVAWCL